MNDVSAGSFDPNMLPLLASFSRACSKANKRETPHAGDTRDFALETLRRRAFLLPPRARAFHFSLFRFRSRFSSCAVFERVFLTFDGVQTRATREAARRHTRVSVCLSCLSVSNCLSPSISLVGGRVPDFGAGEDLRVRPGTARPRRKRGRGRPGEREGLRLLGRARPRRRRESSVQAPKRSSTARGRASPSR